MVYSWMVKVLKHARILLPEFFVWIAHPHGLQNTSNSIKSMRRRFSTGDNICSTTTDPHVVHTQQSLGSLIITEPLRLDANYFHGCSRALQKEGDEFFVVILGQNVFQFRDAMPSVVTCVSRRIVPPQLARAKKAGHRRSWKIPTRDLVFELAHNLDGIS